MGRLGIIFRSFWIRGAVECFVVAVWRKVLVWRDCGRGQGLRRSFLGSSSFSLDGLGSPEYEEENGEESETLTVIEISCRMYRHHILAGYRLAIDLRSHRVSVDFQPTNSIHVLLTQLDLVLRENMSWSRFFYFQNFGQHFTGTRQTCPDLRYVLHTLVDYLFEPSTGLP